MRLLVHLLAPLLRGVAVTTIAIVLSVLLAPSRSRAVVDSGHSRAARPAADTQREPARCEVARDDARDTRPLPPAAPAAPEGDPCSDGEDGEDELDEASDGDVPAPPGQRPCSRAHAAQRLPRRLRGGARDTLRTRLGEAPEAPPPRA